ncbi:MAG TPA: asparagine synthase (glutamine-hydrolyzing) [Rhodanobacteraceae bacterium]|nr:asparagine synthase (glutamine-hydrolyzing) [Rhodanobacteraceae bacterium]
MCGLSGILNLDARENSSLSVEAVQVRRMLQAMRHRGPNGEAFLIRPPIVMAANRLAIRGIDQPQPPLLEHPAGIVVACNGQIDNHRELRLSLAKRGHKIELSTDVAVIPPLYLEEGLDFLDSLRGVFALALWDARSQRLILARDRAGERHLYYHAAGRSIVFASELAALLASSLVPAQIDKTDLAQFLRSGYCPSPASPLKSVRKLGPGERVVMDASGVRARRYWNFSWDKTAAPPTTSDFDRVFKDAVHKQSDVDVAYGVLLSGGLDSALIAAVLRKVRPGDVPPAYCVRFAESSFDEGEQARRVARELGCPFISVTVAAEDLPDTLRKLITDTGELIADPAWIPMSGIAERASRDVRTLLGGEGADELFAGYPTYLGAHWAPAYERLPRAVRSMVRRGIDALPVSDKKVAVSFLLKRFVHGQQNGMARHCSWTANISEEWLRRLGIESPVGDVPHDPATLLDAVQRYDFTHSLPEGLLAKADRGGMLHGVEVRAPFLDRKVIEFAATLPASERVRGLTTKPFLKRYAAGYLPRWVVTRRKRGLSVPLSTWLRGPLHQWARSRLCALELANTGIDTNAALALLLEHQQRRQDHARAIWTLIVLSEWLEWLSHCRANMPSVMTAEFASFHMQA